MRSFVTHEPVPVSGRGIDVAKWVTTSASSMERDGLIRRDAHPTHGRILELYPTEEGFRRFHAAQPFIDGLEARLSAGLNPRELVRIKRWLVDSARALRR